MEKLLEALEQLINASISNRTPGYLDEYWSEVYKGKQKFAECLEAYVTQRIQEVLNQENTPCP